jgi:hypothetical protein
MPLETDRYARRRRFRHINKIGLTPTQEALILSLLSNGKRCAKDCRAR